MKNIKLTKLITKLLARFWFNGLQYPELIKIIDKFFDILLHDIKLSGTHCTVLNFKEMRLAITRYVCGRPLSTCERKIRLTNGFPKRLDFMKEFIDSGDVYKLRFCYTLLNVTRTLIYNTEPKFNTLTDPYTGQSNFCEFKQFTKEFVHDFKLTLESTSYHPSMYYLTNKSGPLGHALMTSMSHW